MLRRCAPNLLPKTMKAAVFKKVGDISIDEKPVPVPKAGEVLMKITTTTICGSDVHVLKGELPVEVGRVIGHEPIGTVAQIGEGVKGFKIGQRVLCPTITPCGHCVDCQEGMPTQCGGPGGGCQIGFYKDGCQAEYMIVPDANYNLCPIPDDLTDEQVITVPDILSTGLLGAEMGKVTVGDTVVVFAQGPVGMCALVSARLMGAGKVIVVDGVDERLEVSKRLGADVTINFKKCDPVEEVYRLTNGRGADSAIEALGLPSTFEQAVRCVKRGGRVGSLGVHGHDLTLPVDTQALSRGMAAKKIEFGMCLGGRERMQRLLNVVQGKRVNMEALNTHRFKLDEIDKAYDLFANQRDGVLKIVITP